MKRRVLSVLTAISFALCVTFTLSWPASYFRGLLFFAQPPPPNVTWFALDVKSGGVKIALGTATDDNRPSGSGWDLSLRSRKANSPAAGSQPDFSTMGFGYQPYGYPWRGFIVVPLWSVIVLSAVLPIRWFWRKRPTEGVCMKCGYDLRATPDRCPECGTENKPQRKISPA